MLRALIFALALTAAPALAGAQPAPRPAGSPALFDAVSVEDGVALLRASGTAFGPRGCAAERGVRRCSFSNGPSATVILDSTHADGRVDAIELRLRRPVEPAALQLVVDLMVRAGRYASPETAQAVFGEAAFLALMDGVSGAKATETLRVALRIEDSSTLRVFLSR